MDGNILLDNRPIPPQLLSISTVIWERFTSRSISSYQSTKYEPTFICQIIIIIHKNREQDTSIKPYFLER